MNRSFEAHVRAAHVALKKGGDELSGYMEESNTTSVTVLVTLIMAADPTRRYVRYRWTQVRLIDVLSYVLRFLESDIDPALVRHIMLRLDLRTVMNAEGRARLKLTPEMQDLLRDIKRGSPVVRNAYGYLAAHSAS